MREFRCSLELNSQVIVRSSEVHPSRRPTEAISGAGSSSLTKCSTTRSASPMP